jgi:hypothetical protein
MYQNQQTNSSPKFSQAFFLEESELEGDTYDQMVHSEAAFVPGEGIVIKPIEQIFT